MSGASEAALESGQRLGRFVVLRGADGQVNAVSATAVAALCETEEGGTLLMLPGGRLIAMTEPLSVVLGWLDGPGRPMRV